MTDSDKLNLDLEDIIREFSEKPAEEKHAKPEEMADTIPLEEVTAACAPFSAPEEDDVRPYTPAGEETRAFTPVTEEPQEEDTRRFAPVQEATRRFRPVTEETRVFIPEATEKTEGDTQEIPQPKRLRTPFQIMRRKIVEGPERQYYALREMGLAKLQTVMVFSFLVAVLSAGITALYSMGIVPGNRLRLVVFGQLLTLLLSAFIGAFQLVEGLFLIGKLRFRPNTLLAFTFVVCLVDCVFCLKELRVPCSAVFSIQVFMSLWGTYLHRKTETSRTDTMRGAKLLSGIGLKEEYAQEQKGFIRCEGDVDHFMESYGREEAPDKVIGWYCFIAFVAALAVGVAFSVMRNVMFGMQIFAAALLAAMPGTIFITCARPAQVLEKRFHRLGVVICGWEGVKGLTGKALFPITFRDMFPEGTVKLNGVKFYGELPPATVVGYAAAVTARERGSLAPLFGELRGSYGAEPYVAESYKAYAGGIGGGVEGKVVLIGTLPMLRGMNVEIPADVRMQNGLGVAVDGVFSCLLAVNYEKTRPAAFGLRVLCGYHGLTPVLISDDLMLTGSFLKSKFGIRPKKIARPDAQERQRLREIAIEPEDPVLSLCVRPTLAAYGYTIAGARALHAAVCIGIGVHILAGALGLGAVAVLAYLGQTALLSPLNILLYQAVWMVPGLLLTEWTRAI